MPLLGAVARQLAWPVAVNLITMEAEPVLGNAPDLRAELRQMVMQLRRQLTWLLPAACAVTVVSATAAVAPAPLAVVLELVEPCLTLMTLQHIPWRFWIIPGLPEVLHQMARDGAIDGAVLRNLLGIQQQQNAEQQQKAAEGKQLDDMLDWVMGHCE